MLITRAPPSHAPAYVEEGYAAISSMLEPRRWLAFGSGIPLASTTKSRRRSAPPAWPAVAGAEGFIHASVSSRPAQFIISDFALRS